MPNLRHLAVAAFTAGSLLGMSPLLGGTSALAAACVMGTVASYETVHSSCNVGPVTFSDFSVTTVTSGWGTVTLGDFTPFMSGGAFGLTLNYASNTGATPSAADVAWTYNVSEVPSLVDAFASLSGHITGTGTIDLNEVLSPNGVTLDLSGPGSIMKDFAPIASLSVIKDQNDFAGSAGSADSSILQNAFSVAIPEASSWAMLLLGLAGLGYAGLRGRKRSVSIA